MTMNSRPSPIAIVGIGCRYPGASTPDEFWQNLLAGKDMVGPYPGSRFPELDALYDETRRKPGRLFTDRGGFLNDVTGFDSQFFEMSPRESVYLDPQHRLLLEVAWEALEDAGQVRESYEKSATGVYMGLWTSEYESRLYESASQPDFYSVTGCGRASASGRISFAFGFHGPSVTVDTACSSSLVAVHMACQALWAGEIDMALAGGANLILGTEISELFTKAKMLSRDGRCKFGDVSADGFVRSEGAGIVVLKKLSRAIADKDPIYALIRGGAVNNDGRCSGFMVPSREGQRLMLNAAWESAGVDPADVRFIEMHGTGTSVGDPVEIGAVAAALAEAHVTRPCVLGSVKTNIGHTESASGVTGLIKAAIALKRRVLPPSLHFTVPNPKIAWEEVPVKIATESVDLSAEPGPLIAGVNSFGLSGTNAHIVLEAAEPNFAPLSQEAGPFLLPISARTPEALRALLNAHLAAMDKADFSDSIPSSVRDLCYSASLRRTHHEHRAAIVGEDIEDLKGKLIAVAAKEDCDGVVFGRAVVGRKRIVFVAPGQGSQWPGMGRELFECEPIFRRAFEECDAAIAAETGWTLADRLLGPEADRYLTQIDVIQPALFAMSVALAAMWRAWGIEPDAVVGHSMGEVAAAHIAGILSLSDAVAVICRRSRLMKTLRGAGSMATVELPLKEVENLLRDEKCVSVGASNGPHTTVISGDSRAVESLLRKLEAKEVYCRQIKVDVASHSAQVDPILDELRASLSKIRPRPARVPMLSTVTGKYVTDDDLAGTAMDAGYWAENLRRGVLFAPAIEKLAGEGHSLFIELSPHPILLPSMDASARPVNPHAVAVASLRREKPERATMLHALGTLYAAGCKIDWNRLYPEGGRCVPLPPYQFQRERCWPEPADPARARIARHAGANPLLGRRFESSLQPNMLLWETDLQIASVPYLNDHRVLRSAVFPASGHIEMALSAAKSLFPDDVFEVRNASFSSAAYIPDEGSKTFQMALSPDGDGRFKFELRTRGDEGEAGWPLRSSGVLQRIDSAPTTPTFHDKLPIADLQQRYTTHRSGEDHYARTIESGLQYGPAFQLVQEVWAGAGESLCRLRNCGQESISVIHPALLDACFQSMAHIRPPGDTFKAGDTYLPVSIEKIRLCGGLPDESDLFAQAILVNVDVENATFRADLRLAGLDGNVLVEVTGLELRRVARESTQPSSAEWLYSMEWVRENLQERDQEKAQSAVALLPKLRSENWIVFADDAGIAKTMKASLQSAGGRCALVRTGAKFKQVSGDEFEIDPHGQEDLDRLFGQVANASGVPTAIIHLWSLKDGPSDSYDAEGLIQSQATCSQSVPGIVQAIARAGWQDPPRLWLVTAGVMTVGDGSNLVSIESAPMWGIGRAVAREHAELRATLVDLSASPDDREARALAVEVCTNGREDRIALRGGDKYVARLNRFSAQAAETEARPLAEGENYRLEILTAGIIDNIELRARACPFPAVGEVMVEVAEAGLNFSDVTKVMGLYPGLVPGKPIPLGNEGVGNVVAVGEGVTEFQVGDEVIALTPSMRTLGLMESTVSVPAELVVRKPACLSCEEAATTMVVYLTAYWSLVEQARIRKGEWVLIHAGTGGVGLAAIEIAKWTGANIIATVGSKEKEDYLRSLGVAHILNSRSLNFAEGVMEITRGRGVDIVLNSLAGEFLSKSLEVLAPYGRFVEMGKRDIYDDKRVGLKVFRNNVSFHVVDVAAAVEDRRAYVAGLLQAIVHRIESGEWKPLPVTSFSSVDPGAPFRFMAQAKHIGKISIRMDRNVSVLPQRNQPVFSSRASYLITGGLGGVALTVAEWMAKNGAGHLVLLSRRAMSDEARDAVRRMEASGAKVTAARADVTSEGDLAGVLETIHASGFPLKGVLHTAAVVDDALVADLTPERFLPVMAPKIAGSWKLHTATLHENLDFFVLFSSIGAIHPQPGMGSYAAANAFLDAFAHYLRGLGRPAISVNWGGWEQIGLARAAGTGRSIEGYGNEGMRTFSGAEAVECLRRALETDPIQVMAVPIDAARLVEYHGADHVPPAFAGLIAQIDTKQAAGHDRSEILKQLAATESMDVRREIFEAYLQEVLGRVLKLATHRIERDRALGTMGLDSLMGLEFVRRLSNSLEIAVPATVVFNYPTVQLLATHLLQRMHLDIAGGLKSSEEQLPVAVSRGERDLSVGGLSDSLSEEDALQALIANGSRGS